MGHLPVNKKLIMHSVPLSLFLVLVVQTTTGELSLPSLPEAVQLLQLETIRGLEQTILEKEDKNRRLEEMIRSVEMETEVVTHNNTMMEEEMEQNFSPRRSHRPAAVLLSHLQELLRAFHIRPGPAGRGPFHDGDA